jgi:hypothetical protein
VSELASLVERRTLVEKPSEQEQLWDFYYRLFAPLNSETPLLQTWPKSDFLAWMTNPDVIKFTVKKGDSIVAIGIVTNRLELDQWLSQEYFDKKFPGKAVWNFMVIAVDPRARSINMARDLLRAMFCEVKKDDMAIFFHSGMHNKAIPRLAQLAGRGAIEGFILDEEICRAYKWK